MPERFDLAKSLEYFRIEQVPTFLQIDGGCTIILAFYLTSRHSIPVYLRIKLLEWIIVDTANHEKICKILIYISSDWWRHFPPVHLKAKTTISRELDTKIFSAGRCSKYHLYEQYDVHWNIDSQFDSFSFIFSINFVFLWIAQTRRYCWDRCAGTIWFQYWRSDYSHSSTDWERVQGEYTVPVFSVKPSALYFNLLIHVEHKLHHIKQTIPIILSITWKRHK